MSFPSRQILMPSLRSLLIDKLQKALQLQQSLPPFEGAAPLKIAINDSNSVQQTPAIASIKTSLNRIKVTTPIRYVSAIAFRLAHSSEQVDIDSFELHISATSRQDIQIEIACTIVDRLNQLIEADQASTDPNLPDKVWQHFMVQAVEPGWIYLELTERGVATWLQGLVDQPLCFGSSTKLQASSLNADVASFLLDPRNSTKVFSLLHTHARCCSLLQLAEETGLICLKSSEIDASTKNLAIFSPQYFPWLLEYNASLRCCRPSEARLISQLIDSLDKQFELQATATDRLQDCLQCQKLAESLSQAFQSFYADCRIWGINDLLLAQTRLGLVWLAQQVMRSLLAELGVAAPTAL